MGKANVKTDAKGEFRSSEGYTAKASCLNGVESVRKHFEPYWRQSPIRYIAAAKTPAMIHVVDGDPRVPRPQSEELHMALKKPGVPTELFVYPGQSHGIPDARNQLLKSVPEKAWMDKWILGKGDFKWPDVLRTLDEGTTSKPAEAPFVPR